MRRLRRLALANWHLWFTASLRRLALANWHLWFTAFQALNPVEPFCGVRSGRGARPVLPKTPTDWERVLYE